MNLIGRLHPDSLFMSLSLSLSLWDAGDEDVSAAEAVTAAAAAAILSFTWQHITVLSGDGWSAESCKLKGGSLVRGTWSEQIH